mmetsp:Transcript_12560/g.31924  ORF Transcript_12560/g.31924 Transcript_12560/m.31924 type:complete len:208 (-) Transcript_12560:582-1205(-)
MDLDRVVGHLGGFVVAQSTNDAQVQLVVGQLIALGDTGHRNTKRNRKSVHLSELFTRGQFDHLFVIAGRSREHWSPGTTRTTARGTHRDGGSSSVTRLCVLTSGRVSHIFCMAVPVLFCCLLWCIVRLHIAELFGPAIQFGIGATSVRVGAEAVSLAVRWRCVLLQLGHMVLETAHHLCAQRCLIQCDRSLQRLAWLRLLKLLLLLW